MTYDDVRALARRLPGVEEGTSYGTPALKVHGKLLVRLKEDGATIVLRSDFFERDHLLRSAPKTFYITDHYRDYPAVLVRLPAVEHEELSRLLEDAWRRVAPKRLITAHDATTYVGFLRAINVRGHASVRMRDASEAFAAAGCRNVRTYIQSGNVIFQSDGDDARIFARIRGELAALLGHEPGVMFRTVPELGELVKAAPLRSFADEPGIKLYVAFLAEQPARRPTFPLRSPKEALETVGMKKLDVFVVSRRKPNGFYGIPNVFIEKELGVPATTRTWSTITKIVASAQKPT